MVQIFQEEPSPRSKFAAGLGQGLVSGLQGLVQAQQKEAIQTAKNRSAILGTFGSYLKQIDPDKDYDSSVRQSMLDMAIGFTEAGLDPLTATRLSHASYEASKNQRKEPEEKGAFSKFLDAPITTPIEAIQKLGKTQGLGATKERLKQQEDPKLMKKPITEMTVDELYRLPQERFQNLTPFEQEIMDQKLEEGGQRQATAAFAEGLVPGYTAIEREFQKHGLAPEQQMGPTAVTGGLKTIGGVARDFGLLGAASKLGQGLGIGRKAAISGGLMGSLGAGGILQQAAEGQTPTVGSTLMAAAPWAAFELAAPLISKAIPLIAGLIQKVPGLNKIVTGLSKKTGQASEALIGEATENAVLKGTNAETLVKGEASAVNAVKDEINLAEARVKEAENLTNDAIKAAQASSQLEYPLIGRVSEGGQAIGKKVLAFEEAPGVARRSETLEKLKAKETPVEEYLKPKEQPKTPAGQVSKELREKPIREEIYKIKLQLQNAARSSLDAEYRLQNIKNAGAPAEILSRGEALLNANRLEHEKLLEKLNRTEFALRNGKPPATAEAISKQIEESLATLKEAAKDPTNSERWAETKRILERDKKYVEQAEKLVARGDLPGPQILDQFIKIEQMYNKAYGDMIKELDSFISKQAKAKGMAQEVSEAARLRDVVKEIKTVNEAKTLRQLDKRKALSALKPPSGAFYRQVLPTTRKNIKKYEDNFIKMRKVLSPEQFKTRQVAKKALGAPKPEPQAAFKQGEAVAKNPSPENINKVAEVTGQSPEKLKETVQGMGKQMEKAAASLKSGEASEKTINEATNGLLSKFKALNPSQRSIVNGVFYGMLQSVLEEAFGSKFPISYYSGSIGLIKGLLKGKKGSLRREGAELFGRSAGTSIIATATHYLMSSLFNEIEKNKLKKSIGDPVKMDKERRRLKEKYSTRRANQIVKEARGY